jgi:hypothetical protein
LQSSGLTNAFLFKKRKDFGIWICVGWERHYLPASCCSISVN